MAILNTMPDSIWNVVQRKNGLSEPGGVEYRSQYDFKTNGVVTWRSDTGSGSGSWKTANSNGKSVIKIRWNNSVTVDTWDLPINTADWQGSAWHDGGGGFYYLYGVSKTKFVDATDAADYASVPVTTSGATYATRLINFDSRSYTVNAAHVVHISLLASQLTGNIVDDVFIKGYADSDHKLGEARANAVAAEFVKKAPWLADVVSISSVNSKPLKGSSKRGDEYWRGVDVLAFLRERRPAPPPLLNDSIPPMPGPKRYFDWEVYAFAGVTFQIALGAVISIDAFHFRQKSNHGNSAWCVSVRFGAGQSVDFKQSKRLLALAKHMGLTRFLRVIDVLSAGPAKTFGKIVKDFLYNALAGITVAPPEYSEAEAVTPFAISDLNGATAYGGSVGIKVYKKIGYSAASFSVSQKMPTYEYKFIDTRNPPKWLMTRFNTVDLLVGVDLGGLGASGGDPASASGQFVGGPLVVIG